jgi:hypothetical protein
MDDADPAVTCDGRREDGSNFVFPTDEDQFGEGRVSFQGELDAGDDHAASVVAAHHIHCNAHKVIEAAFSASALLAGDAGR